jgi:hypothetical protein
VLKSALKETVSAGAGYIYEPGPNTRSWEGRLNGMAAYATAQLPDNLTSSTFTAVCSPTLFGDSSQLIISQWGNGLDVWTVWTAPFTNATTRVIRIGAAAYVDCCVRYPEAFSHAYFLTA